MPVGGAYESSHDPDIEPGRIQPDWRALHVVVIFDNFGPYHLARLHAAADVMRVSAIQIAAGSAEYHWSTDGLTTTFDKHTLFATGNSVQRSGREIDAAMIACLERIRPDVVAIPGWADRGGMSALRWARKNGVPAVVMSASNADDQPRFRLREAVKKWIIGQFSAGLAGGTEGAAYLRMLGLPADRVFVGYDTVDNAYFDRRATAARADAPALRAELGLPERYFLCSCRFVEKKNLPFLIEAFAAYRAKRGDDAWHLVLVGDGEMRAPVEAEVARLGIADRVKFAGFVQYDRLPDYYGLAGAFVLPSTVEQWGLVVNEAMASGLPVLVSNHCGCSSDLVEDGVNGLRFAPDDHAALVRGMEKVAHGGQLAAMSAASNAIVARWSPALFAENLAKASAAALADAPAPGSALTRAGLRLLLGRK